MAVSCLHISAFVLHMEPARMALEDAAFENGNFDHARSRTQVIHGGRYRTSLRHLDGS